MIKMANLRLYMFYHNFKKQVSFIIISMVSSLQDDPNGPPFLAAHPWVFPPCCTRLVLVTKSILQKWWHTASEVRLQRTEVPVLALTLCIPARPLIIRCGEASCRVPLMVPWRSPRGDELRPPANSHVSEPPWGWIHQARSRSKWL